MNPVATRLDDGVFVIIADNPPVNALSQAVRDGLMRAIGAAADSGAACAVIACAGRTFFSGADITEFGKPPKAPSLPEVIDAIEACPIPVIAAIHGAALGGGLEVALGCDYRMMVSSARAGLPEVTLGIIPGAGGTQRLPRLIALSEALEMIVTGKPVSAARALETGLADHVAEGEALAAALAFARSGKLEKRPLGARPSPAADDKAFAAWRGHAETRMRGQIAPQRAIDAVQAACALGTPDGLAKEREIFLDLVTGAQSRALRYAFFAERAASKIAGLAAEPLPLDRAAVIGAGTMGAGIAAAFMNAGIPVALFDQNPEALAAGLARIAAIRDGDLAKGRIGEAEHSRRAGLVSGVSGYDELKGVDLVIEAVFEDMDVKKAVFAELDKAVKPGAILATNTSYLDVNEIASVTGRPGSVLGLHFFSPAHIMRLLEIVQADRTSDAALAAALTLAKRLGKTPVVARVGHGFIGNRMLSGYGREAGLLAIEGASPQDIDAALYDFGMPMGPFAMADMAGLDIGYSMRRKLDPSHYEPRATALHDRLVEMGRKGQKTGAGIYAYAPGSRAPKPDPEVEALIEQIAAEQGVKRRRIGADEIVDRCILALVNEGAKVLAEGVARSGSDIDVVYLHGYGFPRWRGGPMFHADERGLKEVLARIESFAAAHGPRWWAPAPLLTELATKGGRLSEYSS
ncbi:MAG: enoyl-CoA hydratase/isomerase family protein [Maricaulaceae bacterium]|nr:enoyl-CoA hydratase/isomerase family protein [Maricaulaceae bacterium]